MLSRIFFSLFAILSLFLFFDKHNSLLNEEKNEKAILLALLKNTFVDNKEFKTRDDLKNEIHNIKKMQLYPSEYDKFEKFLELFFKYYDIPVKINEEERKILHTSGIFNGLYADVDILGEEKLKDHFDDIKEKAHSLINFIFHSNLIFPQYDKDLYNKLHENNETILHKNEHLEYLGNLFKYLFNLKNSNLNHNSNGDFIINFYINYVNIMNPYDTNPLPSHENFSKYNELYVNNEENKYKNEYDEIDLKGIIADREHELIEKEKRNSYNKNGKADEIGAEKILQELNQKIGEQYPGIGQYEETPINKAYLEKKTFKYANRENNSEEKIPLNQKIDNSDDTNSNKIYEQEKYNQMSPLYPKEFLSNPFYMFGLNNELRIPRTQKTYFENNNNRSNERNLRSNTNHNEANIKEEIRKKENIEILTYILSILRKILFPNGKKNAHLDLKGNNKQGEESILLKSNKNYPIYKQKEIRNKKIQNKDDEDEKNTKQVKNTMFLNLGQNGTNGFLNFFDFGEGSLKKNLKDLFIVMDELQIFNVFETAIFVQKFKENICASYCMNITDAVELSNFDLFLYKNMNFHYTNDSMTIKTTTIKEINLMEFEKILNLLNINGQTIALNCPCKHYSDRIISYCKQYKRNLKAYFEKIKISEYVNKFSPSYALEQLKNFQDKLIHIKEYGKIYTIDPNVEYAGDNFYYTAYYHNDRYFPPLDKPEYNNINTEDFKFPDIDAINFYYNGTLININHTSDITKIINEEIKAKIFYINSYRIGEQFFPMYTNLGRDDHDIRLSGMSTKPKLNSFHMLYRKYKDYKYDNLKSIFTNNKQRENNNSFFHGMNDSNKWIPLQKLSSHEDFYNKKKIYTNMFNIREPKIDEKELREYINRKYDALNEKLEANKIKLSGNNIVEDISEVNEDDTNLNYEPRLKNNTPYENEYKSKRTINSRYLIYFLKNVDVWTAYTYCSNINYINKLLERANFNEDIIFKENYDTYSVSLYFSGEKVPRYEIYMDFFVFLLEKVSLLVYIEDLCGIYTYRSNNINSKMNKFLENNSNIFAFLRDGLVSIYKKYEEKKKYAKELSGISSSNLFATRKNITFNSSSYNNITLEEKDLYQIFFIYMEEILQQRLLSETWLIPFGYMIYSQKVKDRNKQHLKIFQNGHITKFSRNAVDKYIYYEYRSVTSAIHNIYDEIYDNVPEYNGNLKVYKLIIYNDNPSMPNIIIKTTVNVLNIAFLQSILEVLLDIRSPQQFFSYEGKYLPINAFVLLENDISYIFFNYIPNENNIDSAPPFF